MILKNQDDPVSAYLGLGMLFGNANAILHQIIQASYLTDAAHQAFGIIAQNGFKLQKCNTGNPEDFLLNFNKPSNPNKIN
jgi:hypothetical protein